MVWVGVCSSDIVFRVVRAIECMSLPAHWTAETVDSGGVSLQTYRTGSGPPVVLLHGYYDDGRRWVRLADDLRDDHEVVSLDIRGHGQSDAPETGYAVDDRIADIDAIIDHLGLADPVLLGHSMGATTAGWYAASHPERVRGVVLVDPECFHDLPDMDADERESAVREHFDDFGSLTVETLIEEHYEHLDREQAEPLAEASLAVSEHAVVQLARESYPAPLVDQFHKIGCPTLILRSDRDVETRVRDLDAADALPNGRLVHTPDAGHYVFQDEYEAAFKELRAFLRRLD